MAKILFNTAYNKAYPTKYNPVGERITDTTGYITPNVRINTAIAAGEKLVEFRDEQATILNEMYADERALPYNPSELQMLEINAITSERAKKALERMKQRTAEMQAKVDELKKMADEDSANSKNQGAGAQKKAPDGAQEQDTAEN